jgi:hypothetical protein
VIILSLEKLYQLSQNYKMNDRVKNFIKGLEEYSNEDFWFMLGAIEQALVATSPTKLTRRLTGERAEQLAIDFYKKTTGLPELTKIGPNSKDFDAVSGTNGKRYSIKGFKGTNTTSSPICAFNDEEKKDYNFEYIILVKMDYFYQLEELIEIPLETALKYAKYNSRDKNYKISYTKKLKEDPTAKILYSRNSL